MATLNVRNVVLYIQTRHHRHQHPYHQTRYLHLLHCNGYQQQQWQKQNPHGHCYLLHRLQHQMRVARSKEQEELLWEDLFSQPRNWVDFRRLKKAPSHPDFHHRTSRAPLWLNSLYKPHWVDPRLAVPGPGTPHEETLLLELCCKGELDMAMDALSHMKQDGFIPSNTVYISLLKACQKSKSVFHATHVHTLVLQHRTKLVGPLRDALITTFAKCGKLEEAWGLLHTLPHCTVYPWTVMISAFVKYGRGQDALDAFEYMQEIGVEPNVYTFASLFKACGIVGNLEVGRKVHALARYKKLALTPSFGTLLVSMYSKCGSILEAEAVFTELPQRDVFSWNAMLSGYLEHGLASKILSAYRQMQEERETLDAFTYMIVLRACGFLGEEEDFSTEGQSNNAVYLEIGRAIHAEIRGHRIALDALVGNALVSMYGKCGSTVEAVMVLGELPDRDIASWSAMLSAYVQQGQGAKALLVYKKLHEEGLSPDVHFFVNSLRAVISLTEKEEAVSMVWLEIGQALHEDAQASGLALDPFFGNTLVSMYGKCGSVVKAENVFIGLCHHDVVSWNAMLSVYIQHGLGVRALGLYRQMVAEDVPVDALTFVIYFQACGILAEHEVLDNESKPVSFQVGQALHAVAWKKGYCSSSLVCNALISMYGKCRRVMEAEGVFGSIIKLDVVSWNAMLSAYVENGKGCRALLLLNEMQDCGKYPNKLTYLIALQACNVLFEEEDQFHEVAALEIGQALHADVWRKGFILDVVIGSALVNMYGKCGAVTDAEAVFDKVLHRNLVMWNAMLTAFVEQGYDEKVLHLYKQMEQDGILLDEVTLMCVLQACSKTGSFELCGQLYFNVISASFGSNHNLRNTLIHTYGHCAFREDTQAVFLALSQPDQVAWNAWIASYALEGSFEGAIFPFQNMQMADFKPDNITYLSLLYACSHVGLVEKGVEIIEFMSRHNHLSPDVKHFVAIVDLLGRTGDFEKVKCCLLRMPMQANLPLWLCLLGACRKHGNLEMAEEVFKQAIHLEPRDAAAYVLVSNIYMDVCLQE